LAEGIYVLALHPSQNELQYENYKRLGEAAFAAEQGRLAKQWVEQHPAKFMVITFRRFVFFWAGLPRVSTIEGLAEAKNFLFLSTSLLALGGLCFAWKHRIHGIFLFATLLISYPLAYYITFPQPRYRHPIEPQLLILAVYLVTEAKPRSRAGFINI
jgi:ABC-type spermidine/putrescine transport system permease subunit I